MAQTLEALQEQIMRMQEHQDLLLQVLKNNGMITTDQATDGTRHTSLPQTEEVHSDRQAQPKGPKPALPKEYDGNRTGGRAFLNSVKWYMRSRGHEFRNLDQMVSWTLSFMKEGRALTFANQVTRQTDKESKIPYEDWKSFWRELESRFLPIDEAEEAINTLETDRYFQGKQTVDDYCDKFQDLVDHAGYGEGRQVVMKFRKGLESEIADKVALLQERRPADDDIEGWVKMAKEVARQRIRNEAFNQAVRKDKPSTTVPVRGTSFFKLAPSTATKPVVPMPVSRPLFPPRSFQATPAPPPIPPKPSSTAPIPMEVDASRSRNRIPMTCHRCGQPGHFKNQCPKRFDVRFMSTDEIEEHVQQQVLQKDIAALATVETEVEPAEDLEYADEGDFVESLE
jgi:hypothetical protein